MILLSFAPAPDADLCDLGKDNACEVVEISFNIEADNDVALMWELAPDICETARELDDEGLTGQEISDSAVDIFTEEGLISTLEGEMYLRGTIRGCLAG